MFLVRALVISLAVHLSLLALLQAVPAEWANLETKEQIAEIVILEKPSFQDKSLNVVRQTQAPDKLLDDSKNSKARFLSEQDQRVFLETKARKTGLTRNGQSLPSNSWLKQQEIQRQADQGRELPKDPDGYEPIRMPHPNAHERVFEDAPSTVGEVLPDDVSIGEFTALNTDRFKYYSFYSRIEELVRFRWEQELKRSVDSFDRNYLVNVIGSRNWITRIEFWLTRDGHFHSAHIHKESGVKRFDLAAVNSFRDANYFPNPPREMVESDGLIRVQYSFNVHWSPASLVER